MTEWDGICVCGKAEYDGKRCAFGASHIPPLVRPDRAKVERREPMTDASDLALKIKSEDAIEKGTAVAQPPTPPDAVKQFEKWTGFYVKLRDKKKEIEERHKAELAELNDTMTKLSAKMMEMLDKVGAQNIKTSEGTVYASSKYSASLADPKAFMDFVIANNKFDLLDRKANANACRDYVAETGSQPPGVNLTSIRTLGVRRAT